MRLIRRIDVHAQRAGMLSTLEMDWKKGELSAYKEMLHQWRCVLLRGVQPNRTNGSGGATNLIGVAAFIMTAAALTPLAPAALYQ